LTKPSIYSMENSLDTDLFSYPATSGTYSSWTASPTARKVSLLAYGPVALLTSRLPL